MNSLGVKSSKIQPTLANTNIWGVNMAENKTPSLDNKYEQFPSIESSRLNTADLKLPTESNINDGRSNLDRKFGKSSLKLDKEAAIEEEKESECLDQEIAIGDNPVSLMKVVLGVIGGVCIALGLLAVAVYFLLPPKTAAAMEQEKTTTLLSGQTQPPTTPLTSAVTLTGNVVNPQATTQATTSTTSTTTTPPIFVVPCDDLEPGLCTIIDNVSLCDTQFAQANCCSTCKVPVSCRDSHDNCFKIKQYGLCAETAMKAQCCATCKL